jgi:hypothetical protein
MSAPRRTWRLCPQAILAGRIAFVFAVRPDVDRVVIVPWGRGARGYRVVPYGDEGGYRVLGTYDRTAPIAAVLEDFA